MGLGDTQKVHNEKSKRRRKWFPIKGVYALGGGQEREAARQTAERIISVIYVVVVTFVVIFGSSPLLLFSLHVTTKQQYFIPGEMLSVSQILCVLGNIPIEITCSSQGFNRNALKVRKAITSFPFEHVLLRIIL